MRLVFPSSLSFHESFDPENFEKRHTSHTTQAKKKRLTAIVIFLLSFGTFLLLSDTHARASLCLSFRYQRKGDHRVHPLVSRSIGACAFSFSSLGKSCKDYIIYSPRAPKKKSKTLSSARESDPSFFITTRFQKSGSFFGSMRERRGERLSSSFVVEEVRSIDRSFASRVFLFCSQTLSLYINNFEKQAPFERSITLP